MGVLGSEVSNLRVLNYSVRLFAIPFNVAFIWLAVTNEQDNPDYGKLEFNNLVGLKYMVCISAISASFALFGAICSCLRCLVAKTWLFFLTDQVLAYLMVTSMAALGEFIDLAFKGDRVVSWSQACDSYGKFCSKLKLALGLHVIAVCCFLVVAVISAYRVFRRFEPPFIPSKDSEQQRSTT